MNYSFIQTLLTAQIILPIIAILIGVIAVFVAKKQQLLSDKKAVLYVVLSSLLFSVFGWLGFLQVDFMPIGYVLLQLFYLVMGYFNYIYLKEFCKFLIDSHFWKFLLVILIQLLISIALFSLFFNISNDFKYGFWASTCLLPIVVSPLFVQTFQSYLKIPIEIYKIRTYDGNTLNNSSSSIENENLLVFEIEFYKNLTDEKPIRLKAKATKEMIFGDWFELIISDYNARKTSSLIEYYDKKEEYGWIFYTKPSLFSPKKYIDPDLSFQENKLSEKNMIIGSRIFEVAESEE
ncbi:TssN family type VI secretion system protein [Capnocytophaga sputigena]|uniref:TssN family type VI secretion system protein n=1 Tax=Capnocytophaga sputigena TaxID=1019 RepID=UPI002420247A